MIVTDETLDLGANNIDLALRGGAPGAPGLVARSFGEGQLAFYASPEYAQEKQERPASAQNSRAASEPDGYHVQTARRDAGNYLGME